MKDCLFCKIIRGEIPSKKAYEDDLCYAFYDIEPQAPVHILMVPKEHVSSANELKPEHAALVGHMILAAKEIAKELGISEDGYRIVNNCGAHGGQSVHHLHFHLLGGKNLGGNMCE